MHIFTTASQQPSFTRYLKNLEYPVICVPKTAYVYPAIAAHPDIYLCPMDQCLFVAPCLSSIFMKDLENYNIDYRIGTFPLGFEYPKTIAYNALQLGSYFIHHQSTDSSIRELALQKKLTFIPVKQGYVKCNIVLVDHQSIITADASIAKALLPFPIDVLLVEAGHVVLEPFPYGFLGGASGKIGDSIVFNGNLSAHPDFKKITDFIESKGLKVVYFKDYPLTDIGSILTI